MNKYILDTHIFLWSLLAPERLTENVIEILDDVDNEIWLAPISIWEVLILAEKGRLDLDDEPVAWVRNVLKTIPFQQAVLNHEVAMQSRLINLPHQDPADRFIAASAKVYGLTLITADRHLIRSADTYSVLPSR